MPFHKVVEPDDFVSQKVLPVYEPDLRDARVRLVSALKSPAANSRPDLAAKAQASFDCWMEELAEPWWQPEDRKFCRDNFETAMASISGMKVSEKPMPQPQHQQGFLVFFDFDSSNRTADTLGILKSAADAAKKGNYSRVMLTGHADRSGSVDYNVDLSRRRAVEVKSELVALGISSDEISTEAKGESDPLVPTADGMQEPQNRRVEIQMR